MKLNVFFSFNTQMSQILYLGCHISIRKCTNILGKSVQTLSPSSRQGNLQANPWQNIYSQCINLKKLGGKKALVTVCHMSSPIFHWIILLDTFRKELKILCSLMLMQRTFFQDQDQKDLAYNQVKKQKYDQFQVFSLCFLQANYQHIAHFSKSSLLSL